MRGPRHLVALAFLAASPAVAQTDVPPPPTTDAPELSPAVAKVADLAKTSGLRTLVYAELDDQRAGTPAILGLNAIAQLPDSISLTSYPNEYLTSLREMISSEASASGESGWRKILIIVDDGEVTVERGPRPGPIEGFTVRLRAEVDSAFPGHS